MIRVLEIDSDTFDVCFDGRRRRVTRADLFPALQSLDVDPQELPFGRRQRSLQQRTINKRREP